MGEGTKEWIGTALTLALGTLGALVAGALHLPAAALIGSAIAVASSAIVRVRVTMVPRMRDLAFAAIGISIGANVTSSALDIMARWPVSLAALIVSIILTTAVSTVYMQRLGCDRETAILSSTPGALSMAVGLAVQYGDPRTVSVTQTIRLMALTIGLPLLLGGSVGASGSVRVPVVGMSLSALGVLLVLTLVVGTLLYRVRAIPTPVLLAGMVFTGAAHLMGFAKGSLPAVATFPAMVITGSFVGARFAGVGSEELRAGFKSALVMVVMTSLISAIFAIVVGRRLGMSFAQVWVAFAPGGAETMSAMAIALGYDQAYVSSHHVLRILLLSAFLPVVLARSATLEPTR